jgi:hypothetical protein
MVALRLKFFIHTFETISRQSKTAIATRHVAANQIVSGRSSHVRVLTQCRGQFTVEFLPLDIGKDKLPNPNESGYSRG